MNSLGEFIQEYGLEPLGRFYGMYIGIVMTNEDPENRARVLVRIPQVKFDSDLVWAECGSLPSGKDYGHYQIPDVGEWLYIAFVEGLPHKPVWFPGGYAKKETPEEFRNPNIWGIKTRGGHTIIIDDENEVVKISTKAGHQFTLDDKAKEVNLKVNEGTSLNLSEKSIKLGTADMEHSVKGDTLKDLLSEFASIFSMAPTGKLTVSPYGLVLSPESLADFTKWSQKLSRILTKYT
jgi:uncharacterized protein involved in type VI secretion and phage assembly